ncbi:hypothetical protein [Paracoccus zhejiangensis]|uniref:hypothetical protein n=1 Tax=Paracoccus zhejiangensis TaxID=1077935 RepID=UPI001300078C|nr:hypothetical protein [Paracoccus zhejiangensis]
MARVDKDSIRSGQQDGSDHMPSFLRYPADQIDFGYEIVASSLTSNGHRRGPEGLSLTARVYE